MNLARNSWIPTTALALLLLTGCSEDPASLLKRAEEREARKEYAAAILDVKTALQQEPENGVARYKLGRLYNLTFDATSAEKELRKALDAGVVEGGRVAMELGRALILEKKHEEVVAAVKPNQAFEPAILASVHAIRGHANLTLGKIDEARAELQQATKIERENMDGQLLTARFLLAEKGVAPAMEIVDKLIARDRKNFEAWTLKVDLLALDGKLDQMLSAYSSLLEINPLNLEATVGRMQLLMKQGKLDEAQKDLATLQKAHRSHPVTGFLQGELYFAKGKYREALESAQAVLKHYPEYDRALLLSGMAHLALGAAVQAERELSQYLAKNPRNAYARRVLATAQVQLNQGTRALETLDPILTGQVKDAAVLALASEAYARIGEYSKAAQWIERSAAEDSDNPLVLAKKANLRLVRGELELAIEDLARAAAMSKEVTSADTALVLAHLARRDFPKALEAVASMQKKAPQDPRAANLKGLVLLEQGDQEGARRSFESAMSMNKKFVPAVVNLTKLDLAARDTDTARKRFEELLRIDGNNPDALLAYAKLEETLNRRAEAIELVDRAAKAAPSRLQPKVELTRLLVLAKEKQRALATAQEAAASSPKDPVAIELLAGVQLWVGDHNSAIATINRLTQLLPTSPEAHLKVAGVYMVVKRYKDVEVNLRKALALNPGFQTAESMLLRALLSDGRGTDALRYARNLQQAREGAVRGYLLEAELWEIQKKPAEAVAPLRAALRLRAQGTTAVRLFRAQSAAGDRSSALFELRRWVDTHPKDWVARTELADGLMEAGEYKQAIPHIEQVLREGPPNPLALNNLAWAYYKLQDSRALATAEKAFKHAPDVPEIGHTLGWILVESGQTERGLAFLDAALRRAPENRDLRFHRAAALAKSGKTEHARKELNALSADPNFAQAAEARELLTTLR
jgi:putative PEP-CTERM system TPR-repeat lipoprotein